MSQPTANYMLAYMGLFLGIDASRKLDDAERAQFKVRYELLKRSGSIPSQLSLTADEWKDLRAYYLGLARYPFVSGEKTHTPATTAVTYSDQAVTMLKPLADGRYVVGGGLTNRLFFYSAALAEEFSVLLDSPPVHLVERDGGYYVLTIGSILGAVGDENRSALYFIARGSRKAQPIAQKGGVDVAGIMDRPQARAAAIVLQFGATDAE
ncbi:MAG TPA: hypothetical protein PKG67_15670 [Turneriella sp.]|nr:hypothetical protein [Turneriella sp.]